jgi:hypothetical protein
VSESPGLADIPRTWRLPPPWALLVAVLLILCAEVGVRDVDERILDEALVKVDAGLRLFHLHAEGMGLVIIVTTTVAATLVASRGARTALIVLFTAGGAGYPLGYLLWSGLIPVAGLARAKVIAEWLAWIPCGGATIVALWWLVGVVALRLKRP